MLGPNFWFTGIITNPHPFKTFETDALPSGLGWTVDLIFLDDAFCNGDTTGSPIGTQGTLTTRYCVGGTNGDSALALKEAVQGILADAARMGIAYNPVCQDDGKVMLYTEGDGWSKKTSSLSQPQLAQARKIVNSVAAANGWTTMDLVSGRA